MGSPELARTGLFSKQTPAEYADRYFPKLQDDSYRAYCDMTFLRLPRPARVCRAPMLVLGGGDDALFTPAEVRGTARAYRASGSILPGMGHDLMLEPGWQTVADRIISWLRTVPGVC